MKICSNFQDVREKNTFCRFCYKMYNFESPKSEEQNNHFGDRRQPCLLSHVRATATTECLHDCLLHVLVQASKTLREGKKIKPPD